MRLTKNRTIQALLWAAVVIPLDQTTHFKLLEFGGIPAHKVSASEQGMRIQVDKSAMPIVYKFSKPINMKSIDIQLEVDQLLKLDSSQPQGEKGNDDYLFKVGVVFEGDRRLNAMQRMMAAKWVTELFQMAQEGQGLDHVLFLNAVQDPKIHKSRRDHPMRPELLKENNVWMIKKTGQHHLLYQFPNTKKVLGLWFSPEGDDTKSKFQVVLKRVTVGTEDE
ncbi:MAG: hypothetical protein CL675_11510 [Bdellovibrionaceae bacterium]|nr:hypothetical protein [Pseudobdellovibrionaceae bacterium]